MSDRLTQIIISKLTCILARLTTFALLIMDMINVVKSRFSLLNVIRLVLAVSFVGEGVHSESYLLPAISLVFFVQIYLNKKCEVNCEIQ